MSEAPVRVGLEHQIEDLRSMRDPGEVRRGVCTGTVAPGAGEALDMLESLAAVLARADLAQL
jgi:hypothetical protein